MIKSVYRDYREECKNCYDCYDCNKKILNGFYDISCRLEKKYGKFPYLWEDWFCDRLDRERNDCLSDINILKDLQKYEDIYLEDLKNYILLLYSSKEDCVDRV